MHVYGKIYGRFDDRVVKCEIDDEVVKKVLELKKAGDVDALDEFAETLNQNDDRKFHALNQLFQEDLTTDSDGRMWVAGEECVFGYGASEDQARLAYCAAEDELNG